MRLAAFLILMLAGLGLAPRAEAQEQVWVQIEAQPSQAEAEARARAYAGVFPNVQGYAMTTGWYAIVLGPYAPAEAEQQLRVLKDERLIPGDSYIAFGNRFRSQFWPDGATAAPVPTPPAPEATLAPLPDPAPADETPAEARRAEALLSAEERMELQEALKWDEFYAGAIDGAFGPGTRRSMATWQAAEGFEETGILTTAQRGALVDHYRAERAALGLQTLTEDEAGIEITYPSALVEFDRYEPPFVHFREKDGSGFRMLLISQAGDQTTLAGLYDVMQTLEIVPVTGERQLGRSNFVLAGQNGHLASQTEVTLKGGLLKGFTLVWRPEDGTRAARVLAAMQQGFKPIGDRALDDSLGQPLAVDRADLVAGLAVRKPTRSRSGFWLDGAGLVATTPDAVAGCGRITVDSGHEFDVVLQDPGAGLAVLKPRTPLAPPAFAALASLPARAGGEVAVAGFPYEDRLDQAVMTFGTLAEATGLNGEADRARLALRLQPGDAGAPVIGASGAVIGMVLPQAAPAGQVLPDDVAFALSAPAISAALAAAGLTEAAPAALQNGQMAPEDITLLGRDIAVLVSCWE
ncbi:MAG: trypsin-like peptidase domain-containing protein [Rhodobacteraceae bacterium]|nr:trypsin-like peptidase domain-containing protein [Paracoccaceae bacterium]